MDEHFQEDGEENQVRANLKNMERCFNATLEFHFELKRSAWIKQASKVPYYEKHFRKN